MPPKFTENIYWIWEKDNHVTCLAGFTEDQKDILRALTDQLAKDIKDQKQLVATTFEDTVLEEASSLRFTQDDQRKLVEDFFKLTPPTWIAKTLRNKAYRDYQEQLNQVENVTKVLMEVSYAIPSLVIESSVSNKDELISALQKAAQNFSITFEKSDVEDEITNIIYSDRTFP